MSFTLHEEVNVVIIQPGDETLANMTLEIADLSPQSQSHPHSLFCNEARAGRELIVDPITML